jgi:predicted ribosomally synthesized peptide with SipW-like signal peptide
MRRSILTSVVLIGAVLALVIGASTFAVFSDQESISTDPSHNLVAGSVGIAINQGTNSTNGDTNGVSDLALIVDGPDSGASTACTVTTLNSAPLPTPVATVTAPTDFTYWAPGDECKTTITVNRGLPDNGTVATYLAEDLYIDGISLGSSNGTWTQGAGSDFYLGCTGDANGWRVRISPFVDDSSGHAAFMPAGATDTEHFTITIDFDVNAPNTCQNDGPHTLALTVRTTQDTLDPHNTSDAP